MARSTRTCCQVNRVRFFSMKLLPAARRMSATSKGGAFISCAVCGSASLASVQRTRPYRWACLPPSDDVRKDAGKWRLLSGRSVRAATALSVSPLRFPASGSKNYGVRHSRNAHDLYSGKTCHRYHPRYGLAVQLIRYLRRGSAAVVIVRLPDGSQLAVPEWMLKPEVCEGVRVEAKPRVCVGALLEVCRLTRTEESAVADA